MNFRYQAYTHLVLLTFIITIISCEDENINSPQQDNEELKALLEENNTQLDSIQITLDSINKQIDKINQQNQDPLNSSTDPSSFQNFSDKNELLSSMTTSSSFYYSSSSHPEESSSSYELNSSSYDSAEDSILVYNRRRADTLLQMVQNYRLDSNLSEIPKSQILTQVAEAKVQDMYYFPQTDPQCNLHSWSDNGSWSGCCYTSDHANASCIWDKPKEISQGLFTEYGYELNGDGYRTLLSVLKAWKESIGHNDLLMNQGVWSNINWQSIGVGVYENRYSIWLSEGSDP